STVALLVSIPTLVVCLLASAWQLVSLTGAVPYLTGRPAVIVIAAIFLLSTVSQVMFGVMSLFVLHAMAAPQRPIHVMGMVRANLYRSEHSLRA
ncbi:MAG TPA: hypothetical protein VNT81_02315, partial [Vicinamibacterales bacterium]|nr:hypothetical protein [Vicinamibacterales bacterium]